MSKDSLTRRVRRAWKRQRFLLSGMKPWSKGYSEYKLQEVRRVLRADDFQAQSLPDKFGFRLDERIVEYPWFFSRLPAGAGSLLDAGSVLNFEFLLDHPRLREKKLHICTLAPEKHCFWRKGISYVFGDLRALPYQDSWFDWAVCLSTLEHVGMNNAFLYTKDTTRNEAQPQDYLKAVAEIQRVLKPGGTFYASVPFGKAQDHGWLQIFDQPMIENLILAFGPSSRQVEYFLYHPSGWRRSTVEAASDATFFDIHHAEGYDPDYAASARAVCCLELRKCSFPRMP
jgi:hypothetical protein